MIFIEKFISESICFIVRGYQSIDIGQCFFIVDNYFTFTPVILRSNVHVTDIRPI